MRKNELLVTICNFYGALRTKKEQRLFSQKVYY